MGAGVCGLAAAKTLTQRGHQVTLYEQFDLFHDRGSSHGASRIVRRAYSDPFYTACMAEAYPMWSALEIESGKSLLHECGLLYYGPASSPNIVSVAKGLQDLGVPFETLDPSRTHSLLPNLRLDKDEVAIWTPEAGWVEADTALQALFAIAVRNGLSVHSGQPVDPIILAGENDAVVVAAGSWIKRHVPIPVHTTLQTFAYVDAQIEGPVWIEEGPNLPYGFPSDKNGQKIGIHRPGPQVDPSVSDRNPSPEFIEIIRETASRRFGIENPKVGQAKGCIYTTTTTEDFLLGRLASNTFFASACSGHGFKLSLWIGCLLSDFVEGKDLPEKHPRFFWGTGPGG